MNTDPAALDGPMTPFEARILDARNGLLETEALMRAVVEAEFVLPLGPGIHAEFEPLMYGGDANPHIAAYTSEDRLVLGTVGLGVTRWLTVSGRTMLQQTSPGLGFLINPVGPPDYGFVIDAKTVDTAIRLFGLTRVAAPGR